MKSKIKIILILLFAGFMVAAPFEHAYARGLVPCGGYKADGTKESPCTVIDLFVLFAKVTNWLLSLIGIYAVYKIVEAGFNLIVLSAGNEEKIKTYRGNITNAVVGMVFAMLAYTFMNTATNLLLRSKCKVDLQQPLQYLTIGNYDTCDVTK